MIFISKPAFNEFYSASLKVEMLKQRPSNPTLGVDRRGNFVAVNPTTLNRCIFKNWARTSSD